MDTNVDCTRMGKGPSIKDVRLEGGGVLKNGTKTVAGGGVQNFGRPLFTSTTLVAQLVSGTGA